MPISVNPQPVPSQPSTGGPTAASTSPLAPSANFKRSPLVRQTLVDQKNDTQAGSAAYGIVHAGNAKLDKYVFNYETGLCKQANLVTPPANGVLDLTVCMNVSGHSGQADQFANDPNQTFNIQVTFPDGTRQTLSNIPRPQATGAVYSMAKDISFPVTQKGTYTIDTWPTGSGGPGGYIEGREYKLHVGAENFYKPVIPTPQEEAQSHVSRRPFREQ
ncbi:MAG: hypothetical protein ACT4TC_03050 [Myxococcaceae bacterium]